MPTGTWALGWSTGDIVPAAEFAKGAGSIYDTTLGAPAGSIDVTGIVGSYAHLLIVAYLRSDTAAQATDLIVRFNADSGANYGYTNMGGVNVTTSTSSSITATSITSVCGGNPFLVAASATAAGFSPVKILIPHYAGTANHKSVEYSCGLASSTSATTNGTMAGTGVWRSTSAITRVTVSAAAGNLVAGSRLTIYAMGS